MFHCPVGFWVIEQHAIILGATVRSPTVILTMGTMQNLSREKGICPCPAHFWVCPQDR